MKDLCRGRRAKEEGREKGKKCAGRGRGPAGSLLSLLPLTGCLFDLPAYYSSLEMLDVASLSQPRLFLSAYFPFLLPLSFHRCRIATHVPTCMPAAGPQAALAQPAPKRRVPGAGDTGGSMGPWWDGHDEATHTKWWQRGVISNRTPLFQACRFCAARGRGLVFLCEVPVSDAADLGGTQLHLTRLRGTGRARKASSLSAPCSALSSALCSRVHCPSICLGSAEQGACEQPDTSGLQWDPFFSATCTGAVICTLPCIVPLAHEGDS